MAGDNILSRKLLEGRRVLKREVENEDIGNITELAMVQ